jgi:hypothetical protein
VKRVRETRKIGNSERISILKHEWKGQLGRLTLRYKDNTEVDHKLKACLFAEYI